MRARSTRSDGTSGLCGYFSSRYSQITLEFDDRDAVIDQGRHHGVGVDRQILRLELVLLAEIEPDLVEREPLLVQHQANLLAARRMRGVIQHQHRNLPRRHPSLNLHQALPWQQLRSRRFPPTARKFRRSASAPRRMTGALAADEVVAALKAGYRHIDTARKYGTERAGRRGDARLGRAARRDFPHHQGVAREPARRRLRPLGGREPQGAQGRLRRSPAGALAEPGDSRSAKPCRRWPRPSAQGSRATSASPTSTSRCSTRRSGFAPSRWWRCRPSTIPISTRRKLLAAVRQRGMAFVAYCPLGRGRLFSDPVLAEIAKARGTKHRADRAALARCSRASSAIPRSSNPQRIADNFKVFDFTLSDDEMTRIAALKRAERPHRQPGRAGLRRLGLDQRPRNGLATLKHALWLTLLREAVHEYAGFPAKPASVRRHDVGLGIAFAAAGVYFMLVGLGVLPMPGGTTAHAPAAIIVRGRPGVPVRRPDLRGPRQGRDDRHGRATCPTARRCWTRLSYRVLGIGVAGALATIGTWIAIGSGPRAFTIVGAVRRNADHRRGASAAPCSGSAR